MKILAEIYPDKVMFYKSALPSFAPRKLKVCHDFVFENLGRMELPVDDMWIKGKYFILAMGHNHSLYCYVDLIQKGD